MMALEAETDQSDIKNYKCRFSDKVFSNLKHCKCITEKAVSSKWQAYFNKIYRNIYIYIYSLYIVMYIVIYIYIYI